MSNNTIRARVAFSFKGETYELDSVIDLDRCLGEPGEVPDWYRRLAQAAGIDPCSYLYEVLETHEIAFSDAAMAGSTGRCSNRRGAGSRVENQAGRLDGCRRSGRPRPVQSGAFSGVTTASASGGVSVAAAFLCSFSAFFFFFSSSLCRFSY